MTKTTDNHLKNEWTWVYYNKTLFIFKITGRETLYSRKRWHRFNFPCSFPLITTRYPKNYSTDTCKRTLKVELMWTRHGAQIWRMTPLLVLLVENTNPDNHNSVITHLEPDILQCEVKWALGNITTNKASGADGIPAAISKPKRWCC